MLLVRSDAGLIETITCPCRCAGLSQTFYWVHFLSYFCTLVQTPPITIQCAFVSFFLMIVQCKLKRKPSVQYVFRDYVLSATKSWRHIEFGWTRAIPNRLNNQFPDCVLKLQYLYKYGIFCKKKKKSFKNLGALFIGLRKWLKNRIRKFFEIFLSDLTRWKFGP